MNLNSHSFKASDGESIIYYQWVPPNPEEIKGVVQIAHGMGEHAMRYAAFAEELSNQGFAVYANDHRGHGHTVKSRDQLGHPGEGSFWEKAIADMHTLNLLLREIHEYKPIFLFGHSMGSLFSREYITRFGDQLSGVILSGTISYQFLLGEAGRIIIKIMSLTKGRDKESKLLKTLFFGEFNRKFKPNRTEYDWLSRDEDQVDRFVDDPYRANNFSIALYGDVLHGTKKVNQHNTYKKTPKNLPILIFSGEKDPVGEMGKGVKKIHGLYQKAGIVQLQLKLYSEGRHEMLNELNKKEVYNDVINWLNDQTNKLTFRNEE